jgi:hypothetical protein
MEDVHEGGLADAGFSGDEDHPSSTAQRIIESTVESCQLRSASDHLARRARERRRCHGLLVDHRSDELVAAPGNCLDEERFAGAVSEDLADRQNVFLDRPPD